MTPLGCARWMIYSTYYSVMYYYFPNNQNYTQFNRIKIQHKMSQKFLLSVAACELISSWWTMSHSIKKKTFVSEIEVNVVIKFVMSYYVFYFFVQVFNLFFILFYFFVQIVNLLFFLFYFVLEICYFVVPICYNYILLT